MKYMYSFGAESYEEGFVICFLKVPLAYSGNMAVAVRPNGTHVALAGPSKQVADPYCIIVIWRDPEEATNFLDPEDSQCLNQRIEGLIQLYYSTSPIPLSYAMLYCISESSRVPS